MEEINSFIQLYVVAKRMGIRMELLHEDDAGFWTCAWRKDGVTFKTVERRLPFNAALDAFNAAREAAATPAETDLFG